ncbi:hypothetical protein IW261DRAFT_1592462 [Armillaria novae-zelandiae]|uniref:Uncharacterized protein n=1 Tax=Armillaria novae-zelandiae TaxID=153914 RepID=A0AA39TE17_9AGAR|nr:hypothetical protein IW261DRAFT_1592462 [Armillaria novae-zelandiae]
MHVSFSFLPSMPFDTVLTAYCLYACSPRYTPFLFSCFSIQKIEQAQVAIIISQVPFKLWPLTQLQVNLTGSWHARHTAFESGVYYLDDVEEDDAVPIDMHTFKHGYQIWASNIEGQ